MKLSSFTLGLMVSLFAVADSALSLPGIHLRDETPSSTYITSSTASTTISAAAGNTTPATHPIVISTSTIPPVSSVARPTGHILWQNLPSIEDLSHGEFGTFSSKEVLFLLLQLTYLTACPTVNDTAFAAIACAIINVQPG
jgi:hypothetical protein